MKLATGYIIGFLLLGLVVYLVLKKLGLVKAPETKGDKEFRESVESEILSLQKGEKNVRDSKWLEPSTYKVEKTTITKEQAMEFAEYINKALSGWWLLNPFSWGDDEEKLYGSLVSIPTKADISFVSDQYLSLTGHPLKEKLLNDLDKYELFRVSEIINEKP